MTLPTTIFLPSHLVITVPMNLSVSITLLYVRMLVLNLVENVCVYERTSDIKLVNISLSLFSIYPSESIRFFQSSMSALYITSLESTSYLYILKILLSLLYVNVYSLSNPRSILCFDTSSLRLLLASSIDSTSTISISLICPLPAPRCSYTKR